MELELIEGQVSTLTLQPTIFEGIKGAQELVSWHKFLLGLLINYVKNIRVILIFFKMTFYIRRRINLLSYGLVISIAG